MEERPAIHHWHEVADPTEWTFEDEHGHEWFRRGEGESPQETEATGYPEVPMATFVDEIWMAEEHAGCGGRQVYAVKSASGRPRHHGDPSAMSPKDAST